MRAPWRAALPRALMGLALRRAGLLILALLIAISPAVAGGEFVIIAPPGVTPGVYRTVQQAAERCIPLYAGHLRTRLSGQIEIHIFPTRTAFVRGRQTIAGESPEDAQRAADYLGSAIGHSVLINQATHEGSVPGELAGTTCHEILHVYQFDLVTEDGRLRLGQALALTATRPAVLPRALALRQASRKALRAVARALAGSMS